MLLALARSHQVQQHPVRLGAAGHVGSPPRSSPLAQRDHQLADPAKHALQPLARGKLGHSLFATLASWLTLFATVANSRRSSNNSASHIRRSAGVSNPDNADSTKSRGTLDPQRPGTSAQLSLFLQVINVTC